VVVAGTGRSALDYYDFGPIFISSRAKELLSAIDPAAFEFAECETVDPKGKPAEPYWWMAVIRWVETFDEQRSHVAWYHDGHPTDPEARNNPRIEDLNELRMPEGFPGEQHAFWIAPYRRTFVWDEALVDAWRARGLTGATFTPLQQPTPAELKDRFRFINAPYWTNKAP
jgi:hypothetical protein